MLLIDNGCQLLSRMLKEDNPMTSEHELPPRDEGLTLQQNWSEEYAQQVAQSHGLGQLNEAQWQVIHTLRNHFIQYGAIPPMHVACSVNHLEPHCVEHLFHSAREAWAVAGLPDPGDEMRFYT
jgi:sulfur relay (sulfurtransferase) DsrC/TusE family protein